LEKEEALMQGGQDGGAVNRKVGAAPGQAFVDAFSCLARISMPIDQKILQLMLWKAVKAGIRLLCSADEMWTGFTMVNFVCVGMARRMDATIK
jgi:hypothetical protein